MHKLFPVVIYFDNIILLYILTEQLIQVHRFSKVKQPNLFKHICLLDEPTELDFIFEKEIGKGVSRSAKVMQDGKDIHPSLDFTFDEQIRGPELYVCLKLLETTNDALKTRLLALLKKYFCHFIKKRAHHDI